MTQRTLDEWLLYQQQLHPSEIDLGLERISRVWNRLHPEKFTPLVLTIAGTNGKGSSVAYLEAILLAAGYRTGCYTSPHLVRYNERIRLDGREADDDAISAAFESIEQARGDVPLTYFEFGTLAALLLFEQASVDVAVLEVGLGGRLDAANMLDADGVIITSIGLDHTDWLGDTLEQIAREKAGVMRQGRPAIIAQQDAPSTLFETADSTGAVAVCAGSDYVIEAGGNGWDWKGRQVHYRDLPLPALAGKYQLANAAGVIALLVAMRERLPVDEAAIREGIANTRLAGRFQVLHEKPLVFVDVAHNREAAGSLLSAMQTVSGIRKWRAVMSMYRDKPVEAVASILNDTIDHWFLYALEGSRAARASELQRRLEAGGVPQAAVSMHDDLSRALEAALQATRDDEAVIVFGSFEVAGDAIVKLRGLSL